MNTKADSHNDFIKPHPEKQVLSFLMNPGRFYKKQDGQNTNVRLQPTDATGTQVSHTL